jgi:hypothetical protein
MGLWSKTSSFQVNEEDMGILQSLIGDDCVGSGSAAHLLPLFYRIIMRNKPSLQKASLKCISVYDLPGITHHLTRINRLLDDDSFKNELVVFATG